MTHNDETPKEYREFGIFYGPTLHQKAPPKETIIEDILSSGDNIVISSRPGVGKSILALQIVANLTTGTRFLNTFDIPKPCNVLYVQTESSRSETLTRIKQMSKAVDFDHTRWAHYNIVGIYLNTEKGRSQFIDGLRDCPYTFDVIVIDPLYPTVKGSLNSDEVAIEWQVSARYLKEIYPKISFIVFHHDSTKENWQSGRLIEKAHDDIIGSTMWSAWMTANYKMVRDKITGKRILFGGKGDGRGRTGSGVSEIHMRLVEPTPLYFTMDEGNLNTTEQILLDIFTQNKEAMYRRIELEQKMEKSKPTVCRALVKLQDNHKIKKVSNEEGLVYYQFNHNST